jgi:uncharacterized protein DUF4145
MAGRGISIYCPHCHLHTSIEPAPVEIERGYDTFHVGAIWKQAYDSAWWIGVCNYCNRPVLVQNEAITVYPHPLPEPTDANVPEIIRTDLDEAKQCFAVSAWRAAAVMARRAMQSAAIERGAVKDRLADQIAELAIQGKITVDLKEWADVVRWVGNDAAHPGGQPVAREDAEDILKLAEQFLHVLYVAPAIAKELRTRKGK